DRRKHALQPVERPARRGHESPSGNPAPGPEETSAPADQHLPEGAGSDARRQRPADSGAKLPTQFPVRAHLTKKGTISVSVTEEDVRRAAEAFEADLTAKGIATFTPEQIREFQRLADERDV